jgi:hypothetical protein
MWDEGLHIQNHGSSCMQSQVSSTRTMHSLQPEHKYGVHSPTVNKYRY